MGITGPDENLTKGPVLLALEDLSNHRDARERMSAFRDELIGSAKRNYEDLSTVLDRCLFPHWNHGLKEGVLEKISKALHTNWFSEKPALFEDVNVREIYGEGLLKLLDSSLRGHPRPTPIEAYWLLNHANVEALIIERTGVVTFLIATPRPKDEQSDGKQVATQARDAWTTTKSHRQFQFQVHPENLSPDVKISPKDDTKQAPTKPEEPIVRTYKVGGL